MMKITTDVKIRFKNIICKSHIYVNLYKRLSSMHNLRILMLTKTIYHTNKCYKNLTVRVSSDNH